MGLAAKERGPCSFEEGREDNGALAEWVPSGGNTADGARSLNYGLVLVFLIYGTYPRLDRGRRKDCVWVF